MYPFLVLNLPPDATDEDVDRRYHALLREYPPDRAPGEFRQIRQAFEALRGQRERIETRVFYFDRAGRALEDAWLPQPKDAARRRLSPDDLATCLCAALKERDDG